jgi:hypothetical protein
MTTTTFNTIPERFPINSQSSLTEITARAGRLYNDGMEEYGQHVAGEDRGKAMFIGGLAMGPANGTGIIYFGHPGSSKSLMLSIGHGIVEGIEDRHMAEIPHSMDLKPSAILGRTEEIHRTTFKDGQEALEVLSQTLRAIVRNDTKGVRLDEITRTSPFALNAALKFLQNGKIDIKLEDGSYIELTEEDLGLCNPGELDVIVSASNNHGTAFTNKLDPAIIGRQAEGVFTGVRPEDEDQWSDVMEEMVEDHTKVYGHVTGDDLKKVITRPELHVIRGAITYIDMKKPERDLFKQLNNKMLRKMAKEPREGGWGVNMADGRSVQQLLRVTKKEAMLENSLAVSEENIREASRKFATAKLGLLPKTDEAKIDAFVYGIADKI